MPVATTTLPIIGSTLSGVTGGAGVESLYDVEQILFVDKTSSPTGTEDGTLQDPYQSIGDAVTAANGLTPAVDNRICIFVWPGVYDEAVTLADDYVYLRGVHRDAVIVERSGTPLTVTAGETHVSCITFLRTSNSDEISLISVTTSFFDFLFVASAANDATHL